MEFQLILQYTNNGKYSSLQIISFIQQMVLVYFLRDINKGYIANNTILTNLSWESQLTGILGYFIPETVIKNNSVTSAVGIEVGGFVKFSFTNYY